MSAINFRPSLALVLAHEGGYVNHPRDPGGPTNQGVTQRVYDAYRDYHRQRRQSVKAVLSSEVSDIYNKNYWKLVRGDSLPVGLDYCVFDFAVNSGVSRAVRYLQRAIGVVDDGVLGMISMAALDKLCKQDGCETLIAQYCANRLAFLRNLGTFPTFGKGWTRRVIGAKPGAQKEDYGVIDYATFMAREKPLIIMPQPIGSVNNETAGKAFAPVDTFILAPTICSVADLKTLSFQNDDLAALIAAG